MTMEPRERPILMNTWSVQHILEGCKVQTRRVLKVPNPETIKVEGGMVYHRPSTPEGEPIGPWYKWQPVTQSPYGVVGDRLWVRETFIVYCTEGTEYGGWPYETDEVSGRLPKITQDQLLGYKGSPTGYCAVYLADGEDESCYGWRKNMFMPKWASRIVLELDDVRVERVQDITGDDAWDEGAWWWEHEDASGPPIYVAKGYNIECFSHLWDSINKDRGYGWDTNCWVWCLTFHVVERRDK